MRNLFRKNRITLGIMATAACMSAPALALPTIVDSSNDTGAGTLRAAIENGASDIVVATSEAIMLTSPLVYNGERPLTIQGTGQTIKATMDFTLLEIASGVNLTVEGLNFEGPGGFDIQNQSTADNPGKGIFVDVQESQQGWVKLTLIDVTVSGVANHGVHVSDCDLADDCGGGSGGAGGGSPASIAVELRNVHVMDVGYGKFDADGLRVDERGAGSIVLRASNASFTGVGADGAELDEGQDGVVKAFVSGSVFNDNGGYCDPELLEPQLAAHLGDFDDEGEYEESEQVTEDQIPGAPAGTLDDRCFEYVVDTYDSGFVEAYEIAIDVDDGFDIDEADDGILKAVIRSSEIRNNLDEGIDFDEAGDGGVNVAFIDSVATGNTDDGFKVSEEDAGGVQGLVYSVSSMDNGGKGIVLEEEGDGPVSVLVIETATSNNDDSDDTGLEVVQDDDGTGSLVLRDSDLEDGYDAEGVDVRED